MENIYENLKLSNDYVFAKAMRNKKLCKKLLEIILDIEILDIEYIEEQKAINEKVDARSVRLDVYVKDDIGSIYNIEIQTTNPRNLPKRSRYYQAMIDINLIGKGADYNNLNKSYIIFICMEDIFKTGRHIYTFENVCLQDKDIKLGDDTTKVFLNPYGNMDDIGSELKNFLLFLVDGTVSDEFTKELSEEVKCVTSNSEWRREYMTLYMRDMENREAGREEGFIEGHAEGHAEGLIEGHAEGLIEGHAEGLIEGLIKSSISFGIPKETAINSLINEYNLTLEEATVAYERYVK